MATDKKEWILTFLLYPGQFRRLGNEIGID